MRLFVILILCFPPLASAPGEASKRAAIYPFDVTVAGEKAKIEGNPEYAIFAKIGKPVASDAEVRVGVKPERIIVNIFPCDAKGAPKPGAQAKAKVIMASRATTFRLDQTLDKSTLDPGLYIMNVVLGSKGTSRVMFAVGSKGTTPAASVKATTPEKVVESVFVAARTGEFSNLKMLLPPSGNADGDVKRVCGVGEADEAGQSEFRKYFSKGGVSGKARIKGDKAEVDFLFGPDGRKKETMELVRENGRWYLSQF